MNKWMGVIVFLLAVGFLGAGVTRDETTGDDIRWFEMDFSESKGEEASSDLVSVKLVLGFRHHNTTGKQTAYLSLAVDSKENAISWREKGMTLTGSDGNTYHLETTRENKGFFGGMTKNVLYRLDIQEIVTPQDLISFFRENMINSQNSFTFTLKDRSTFDLKISTKNFQTFFATLANAKKLKGGASFDLLNPQKVKPAH